MNSACSPISVLPVRWWGIGVLWCLAAGIGSCWAHGDLHERIRLLDQAVIEHPQQAERWLQRADLRRQHGEWAAALADADQAVRLRPDWPPALLQRARILLEQQEYAAAQSAATACLKRAPGNADALVVRSRCQVHLGNTAAAIDDLSSALKGEYCSLPLPDLYLERARLQAGQGEFHSAVRGLDVGMGILGPNPSLALAALAYERQAGDFEAALNRLASLQRFLPHATCLALKAEVLLDAGRPFESAAAFGEASSCLTNAASTQSRSTPQQTERLKAPGWVGPRNVTGATRKPATKP